MKKALINLLKVKSIITILVMGVFTYLAVTNQLQTETVSAVIMAIITYYFTKREDKTVE